MGKESNVQAPDPRLTDAQIRSLDVQNSAIQQIMNNSADLAPLQRRQLEQSLAANEQAYADAQQDREWTLARRNMLSGVQDQIVNDAKAFNLEDRTKQLVGQAYGDVNQAFSSARGQSERSLARMGVNPNDGRMTATQNTTNAQQALALTSAASKVREAARQEGYQLTNRANDALSGYATLSSQALSSAANYGTAGLGLANTGLAGLNSGYGAAATAAGGMGSNATSAYTSQANAYNQANAAAGSGAGALVGAGGTIVALAI